MSFRLLAAFLALVLLVWWFTTGPTLPSLVPGTNPGEHTPPPDTASPAETVWQPRPETLTEDLARHARALSERAYVAPSWNVPDRLAELDFDGYRSIRFRPAASVWRDEGMFEVQLFHLGGAYDTPVSIHFVEGDSIREQRYDPALFSFEGAASEVGDLPSGSVPAFAGFRVHYPLNAPERSDEVAAFLGASYFRILGAGHQYGLSARGLAIDPATDGPEEFPDFKAFWITRPEDGSRTLTVHALLDGPSVVGAYRFELRPGASTELMVDAHLFGRRDVSKLGVAPLSSMFLHAPGHGPRHDDFRPRVHDSDGLQMLTGRGEWIWRPLSNGPGFHVTSLRDEDPSGFGLFQRARDFEDYLDLEARYDRRPSYWVEVIDGDWGTGGVELMEIPTPSEFNDNIAAYWVPDRPLAAGEERRYAYRLSTHDARPPELDLAHVERTAVGRDALPGEGEPSPPGHRRFVVDFVGGVLTDLGEEDDVRPDLSLLRGSAEGVTVQPLPGNTGRRVTFTLIPDGDEPADMRLRLLLDDRSVSETWSYVWYPRDMN
ncbi:MAG: glucan biosynthesis protein [Gemmatimonadota bacterium]|nr:glucan biosynthesis protein [Gemmatimonadota bacterium]